MPIYLPGRKPAKLLAADVLIEPLNSPPNTQSTSRGCDEFPVLETDEVETSSTVNFKDFKYISKTAAARKTHVEPNEMKYEVGGNDVRANELARRMFAHNDCTKPTILSGKVRKKNDVKPVNYYNLTAKELAATGIAFDSETLDYINAALSDLSIGKSILNAPAVDKMEMNPTPPGLKNMTGDAPSNDAEKSLIKETNDVYMMEKAVGETTELPSDAKNTPQTSPKKDAAVVRVHREHSKERLAENVNVLYSKMSIDEKTSYYKNLDRHRFKVALSPATENNIETMKSYIAGFELAKNHDTTPHQQYFETRWEQEQKKRIQLKHKEDPKVTVPKRVGLRVRFVRGVLYSATTVIDLLAITNIIPAPEGVV